MEGDLFEVTVPSDIQPEQFAGLAIRHSDGTIDPLANSNSWTPGEVVKIVCFAPDKNEFRYAYFREEGDGKGSTTNFPITQQSSPNMKRSGIKAGERLVRYSVDSTMAMSEFPQDDDFEIIFNIQNNKKQNKSEMATPRKPSD